MIYQKPHQHLYDMADNGDMALEKISSGNYHIILLDLNFPVSEGSKFLSGEDLGIKIKEEYPTMKVIILTVLEDSFRLYNILNNINPEGFLIKGEVIPKKLIDCIETVISTPPYYNYRISKLLHSRATHKFSQDKTDRIILYQLSLGTKTKDLPQEANLSLRAIEDRKKKLKNILVLKVRGIKS